MKDFSKHMWSRRFCFLGTVFLVLGVLSLFTPAHAGYIQVCTNNECQWVWVSDQ